MTTSLVDNTQQPTGSSPTGSPYAQKVVGLASINSQGSEQSKLYRLPEEVPSLRISKVSPPQNPFEPNNLLPNLHGLSANNQEPPTPPSELTQLAQDLLGGIKPPGPMVRLVIASAQRQQKLLPQDEKRPPRVYGAV